MTDRKWTEKWFLKKKQEKNNPHHKFQNYKDGDVSDEEFKKAVQDACVGKNFDQFPAAFKTFITNQYSSVDVDGKLLSTKSIFLDCK